MRAGVRELREPERSPQPPPAPERVRRPGGGRPPRTQTDPTVVRDLERLVDPAPRGDPPSPQRWTCKSTATLAAALGAQGHTVSARQVAQLLHDRDGHWQAPRQTRAGIRHPDRDAPLEHLAARTRAFQHRGQPVVSVDPKQKERVGDVQPQGREWRPAYEREAVRVPDFPDPPLSQAIPYGVDAVIADVGWGSVGVDPDTAAFAGAALRPGWERLGRPRYRRATELLVVADGGGSQGRRNRLGKWALPGFADATGRRVTVCPFPPGTSQWNKSEHRLFCHSTPNWRGRPPVSLPVIVRLLGATKTAAGLTVPAALDTERHPVGVKVREDHYATINLQRADFHGDGNYTITPQ